jgi:hypothetical protein
MLTSPLPFKATKTARDDAETHDSERNDQKQRRKVAISAINPSTNENNANQPPVPER